MLYASDTTLDIRQTLCLTLMYVILRVMLKLTNEYMNSGLNRVFLSSLIFYMREFERIFY